MGHELAYPPKWTPVEPRVVGAVRAFVAPRDDQQLRIEHLGGHRWQWSVESAERNQVADVVDLAELATRAHGYVGAIAAAAADGVASATGLALMSTTTLYHVTTKERAASIAVSGFADDVSHDGTPGVAFAHRPMCDGMVEHDVQDLPPSLGAVVIVVPLIIVVPFQIKHEGDAPGFLEWLLPASVANAFIAGLRRMPAYVAQPLAHGGSGLQERASC